MGLQQWVLWAPIAAALMTAMIIMDEVLTRLFFRQPVWIIALLSSAANHDNYRLHWLRYWPID